MSKITISPEEARQVKNLLAAKIQHATTRETLLELEKRVTLHYNNGTITPSGLAALDTMIVSRLVKLDLKIQRVKEGL